jgi:ABC-type nitrate/sulfonate/bicarbonate transport system substrate-binding protein
MMEYVACKNVLRAAFVAGVAASAIATAFGAASARAADTIHVGKAQGAAWTFLAADIGIEQGIFARYGLDVEIVDLAGDAKVQQALASKSIEIGLASGPGMAFAAKGSPVIGVAAFAGAPRNIAATVLADSPIKTVADLKGKLIAVSTAGSLSDWLATQMAIREGWGADGVRRVALGAIDASVAALKAHQVDAMVLATETGFALEEKNQARIITGMDRYAPNFITHVVFAERDIVQSNPALVDRFLKGFFAAIAFVKTNKEATSAVAERIIHMTPGVAAKSWDFEAPMLTTDGRFDPKAVEALKQSFIEMGTLDRKPADGELFTTQFLPITP